MEVEFGSPGGEEPVDNTNEKGEPPRRLPFFTHPRFCASLPDSGPGRSVARVENDRVDDRDDAAFGLRERQIAEAANDATDHALIRKVRASIGGRRNRAGAIDDELHRDATLEVRVRAQTVLVAETEATEVLTNDALDDLRREATVDLRGALTKGGRLGLVSAAETAVAVTEALTRAGAGAVSERSDVAEADAFAATAAAFADAREAEAARAERVADGVTPSSSPRARTDLI